jgi:hypothetical protein
MADNKAWQVIQTAPFIGGLNTEVNDLQDATQYTSDELNMVIKNNGTRARRLGVDYEEGYKLSPNAIVTPAEDTAFSTFNWTDISEDKNIAYIVVQAGGMIYFYEDRGAPFSKYPAEDEDSEEIFAIDLSTFSLNNEYDYTKEPVSFANAYGGLFVCSKAINPFYITKLSKPEEGDPPGLVAEAVLDISAMSVKRCIREIQSEKRFFINGIEVGTSHVLWTPPDLRDYYLYAQLKPYDPANYGKDDFGVTITGGIVSTRDGLAARMRTANYYARWWNSLDPAYTRGIVATALTPYAGDYVTPEEAATIGEGPYAGPREFLKFTCPAGPAYSGLEIKMLAKCWMTDKASRHTYATGYERTCITSEYIAPTVRRVLDIRIRDFEGIPDMYAPGVDLREGGGVTVRPELPSNSASWTEDMKNFVTAHTYNLWNQGWDQTEIDAYVTSTVHDKEGVNYSWWPSLNYQWFLSKDSATQQFRPAGLEEIAFGSTRAPTGRGIVSYLEQDRSLISGIPTDPTAEKIAKTYPRTPYFVDIIAYAGRIWYLSGDTILYSQVLLDDITKADKCYQEADPTSETISDLVDTDGGMIQIPELGDGIKFCIVGAALVVVGTKSIQLISGGENNAFTATAYVRGAMQAYTTNAPQSFVTTEYGTFFWSDVGIVLLSYQEGFAAQNITESTINTFYQKIPDEAKKNCVGIYNRAQKQIVWMYPGDVEKLDEVGKQKWKRCLNRVLIYDILKNSWTPFEVPYLSDEAEYDLPWIVGGVTLEVPFKVNNIYPIYAEDAEIVDDEGYRILVDDPIEKEEQTYKSAILLCVDYNDNSRMTFGYFDNLNCLDWAAGDLYGPGVNYNSYLVSHPINLNSTAWNKTIPYLLTYFRRTEQGYTTEGEKIYPSACQGAIQWDWNNSGKAGKWDAQQELYRYDKHFDSYTVVDDDGNLVMTLVEDFDTVVDGAFADAINITDPIEKGTLLENDYVFSKTRIYGSGRAFKVKLSSVDNNYFIVENVGFNIYGDARI